MEIPVRVQRKRTKGAKMDSPNGLPVVYVGRPSKWGNPYRVGDEDPMLVGSRMTARDVVRMYEWYIAANSALQAEAIVELKGKNLACWCKPGEPCHADVLLEVANG
jgi:hypothetical protein